MQILIRPSNHSISNIKMTNNRGKRIWQAIWASITWSICSSKGNFWVQENYLYHKTQFLYRIVYSNPGKNWKQEMAQLSNKPKSICPNFSISQANKILLISVVFIFKNSNLILKNWRYQIWILKAEWKISQKFWLT